MNWNVSRRNFINLTSSGLFGLALTGLSNSAAGMTENLSLSKNSLPDGDINLIGTYGEWASKSMKKNLPSLSFRRKEWTNVEKMNIMKLSKVDC